jgi:hypothetical protein
VKNSTEAMPAQSCLKKDSIHLNNLPASMRDVFRDTVILQLREFVGMVAPQQSPKEEDIGNVWAYCTGSAAPLDDQTFFILMKLVCTMHCSSALLMPQTG